MFSWPTASIAPSSNDPRRQLLFTTGNLPHPNPRGSNQFETEVAIGDRWYHQTFSYLPESKCCRIYGLDVTELKSTEQRLLETQHAVVGRVMVEGQ